MIILNYNLILFIFKSYLLIMIEYYKLYHLKGEKMKATLSIVSILALSGLAFAGGDIAPVEPVVETPVVEESSWEFRLSPYAWIAGFKGDVAGIPGLPPTYVDISPSDALDDTDSSWMGMFQGKKNGKGFFMDFLYSNLESENAIGEGPAGPIILTSKTKTTIFSASYLHEIYNNKQSIVDVFAGARYWNIDSHLSLGGPGVGNTEAWFDPLIGIKGNTVLGDSKFFVSGGAAIGGFGVNSELFYDLNAYLGYQWTKSFSTSIGYRIYDLDYENDGFVYDVRQEGFVIGFTRSF